MKFSSAVSLLLFTSATVSAFAPNSHANSNRLTKCWQDTKRTQLASTAEAPSDVESIDESSPPTDTYTYTSPVISARNDLLRTANALTSKSPTGIFITVPSARAEFIKAVARLEAIAPTTSDESEPLCIGEWALLATSRKTSLDLVGEPKFSLPKLPIKIKDSIRVTQSIRSTTEELETIDRIDNIIEFDNTATNLLPKLLNPFQIDGTKVILVHKARVETFVPFRMKMSLQSVVVNVAGQSKNLDPMGADILGINIPSFQEWMNSGEFDTTYVDGNVRVSRGTIGFLEETRIFVKKGYDMSDIMEGMDHVSEPETKFEKVASAIEEVANAVGELGNDVINTIEKDLEFVKEDIETGVQEIRDVVEDDLKDIGEALGKVKSVVIGDKEVEEAVDSAVDAVAELGMDVIETIEGAAEELKIKVEDRSDVGTMSGLGKDAMETIEEAAEELQIKVEDDAKKIKEAVEDVREAIGDDVEDVKGAVASDDAEEKL